MNSEISFFKVITSSEKMMIPRERVSWMMRGVVGKRVILRSVDEKGWSVKVERDEDGFSFKKGWPQFYQENSLNPGDILVFTSIAANAFDFRFLRHNACDTHTRRGSTATQITTFNPVKEEEEEEDDEGDEEEEEAVHLCKACTETEHTSLIIRVKEEEEEEEEEEEDDEENVVDRVEKKKADWYGHDIFNSGLAIRPTNPYFVSRTRKARKNELYIPRDVVVDFQLKIPTRLIMFDAGGKTWVSTVKKWVDGRLWCTGGWKSLCKFNGIGVNDTCICEFVQRKHGLSMLVRHLANGGSTN